MQEEKLRFLLVGCGRIGSRHAQNIINYGQLVAVCDKDHTKSDAFGKEYRCKSYDDISDMLNNECDANVVSICTPNGLHCEHTIISLQKGLHVLVEKPMALNIIECGDMIKEAEKHNKRIFIVKQNRFNPPVVAVKKILEQKKLGRILSVQLNCFWNRDKDYYTSSDWKGTLDMDGGTLFTQFSHFIDLLYWLIGDVKKISAFGVNSNHKDSISFEDNGVVILEFYSGTIGSIHYTVNSYRKNMEGSITIFGEKGTIKIGGEYLNKLDYQNIEDFTITDLPEGNKPNEYGGYQGSMSNHEKVYENIVDVLQNRGSISTNAFEGLKTVEIIQRIYEATRS